MDGKELEEEVNESEWTKCGTKLATQAHVVPLGLVTFCKGYFNKKIDGW